MAHPLLEDAMDNIHLHDGCELCGAGQDKQPLVQTAYRGHTLYFCPPCFHAVLRGEHNETLADRVRAERTQKLNDMPLARPGLRY
jgi:hypothetical protein